MKKKSPVFSFFTRTVEIPADLRGANLIDLTGIKDQKNVYPQDPIISAEYTPNHFLVEVLQQRRANKCLHKYQYFPEKKIVKITSWCPKEAFLIYAALLMFIVPLSGDRGLKLWTKLLPAFLIFIVVLTLILKYGMISEAKELQRELTIRLNVKRMLKTC